MPNLENETVIKLILSLYAAARTLAAQVDIESPAARHALAELRTIVHAMDRSIMDVRSQIGDTKCN